MLGLGLGFWITRGDYAGPAKDILGGVVKKNVGLRRVIPWDEVEAAALNGVEVWPNAFTWTQVELRSRSRITVSYKATYTLHYIRVI